MFISKVTVQNFRLFPHEHPFIVDDINIPDLTNEGSGLTVFVGENGCGKSSLLDAIALPLLSYKADNFSFHDINNPGQKVHLEILASANFMVDGTMPKGKFEAKGFAFEAGIRAQKSRTYLSSVVVSDQKYVRADGATKPKDGSPDLRVNVNNPFKGARFSENDVLFLDRNRTFQTRSGTYNPTRFDRLMDDFSFQYIRSLKTEVQDIDFSFDKITANVENAFLKQAISKFKDISGYNITLSFIDNWKPFDRCFFAEKKANHHQISLDRLGSGYEMIFALLYSFFLSQQSGKQLILLIDEPELHLHPALQERFVSALLEVSRSSQVILSTHSPLLVKHLLRSRHVKAKVLVRDVESVNLLPMGTLLLPFRSANEINFLAFDLATEEHHNELYEELKYRKGEKMIKEFDQEYFQGEKGEEAVHPWKGVLNQVSVHTFVRNQIHHRRDCGEPKIEDIRYSIRKMRSFLTELVEADE